MKNVLLFVLTALIVRAAPFAPLDEPKPATAPAYFAKWTMVKMWPQPQGPLPEAKVAEMRAGDPAKAAYVIAYYKPSGALWTVEEISGGKRKIKFAYTFDPNGQVIQIDMFLPDGKARTYYSRYGKPPPGK